MGASPLLWALLAFLPGACGQCHSPPWLEFALSKDASSSVFDVGSSLTYECRPGYMTKKFNIICLENSTWSRVNENICKRKSCVTPSDLPNGRINVTDLQFGSTFTYSCNEGYILIGHSFNRCILSGNTVIWEKKPPLCERIRCSEPPTIPNGSYTNPKDYYHYGMVVSYECNTGPRKEKLYDLEGNKTLHCTSKDNRVGIWSSPPPRCVTPAKCNTPEIMNGRRVSGFRRIYSLNDAVEFECNDGFTMIGSKIVRCQINSQWEPALPVCFKVKSCEDLQNQFPNGRVQSPHPPQLGTKVLFECNEGFWLNGSPSSTCVLNRMTVSWSNKLPVCEKIFCDSPPPIINGRIPPLSGNKLPFGTTISYTCYRGYRMIGTKSTRCTSNNQLRGVWSAPAPQCEAYNKTALCSPPRNLGRHLQWKARPPYRHGDTLKFSCDTSFTIKGDSTLWCQANSTWGPSPVPTCESACPSPPMIPNGWHRNSHRGPVAPGLSVTYSCEPGYLLIGEKTILCLSSGVWNATAPRCKEALCDPLIKIPNGQVKEPSHLQIGAIMTFSCKKGYRLHGQASSQCVLATEGAVWSKIPVCIEVVCPSPPVIENGKYTTSSGDDVPYGTKVIYKCNTDPERGMKFNLIGESTIHCTSDQEGNGIWNATAPRCEISASSIQCQDLRVPNGYKISGQGPPYFYNDSVVFRCNLGFTLKGSSQIRCSASGTWDPEAPICEKAILCPPPPVIENGKYMGNPADNVPYGTKVTYKCNPDPERGVKFNLIGESTIYCTSGKEGNGIWNATAPRCELSASSIQCQDLRVPNGYKISGQGPPYFYNDSVVFRCNLGFTLKGSSQIRCSPSGTWDPEAPICETAILCPPPPVIENGKFTSSPEDIFPYGTKVTYRCNPDPERGVKFNLIGESTIHCKSNKEGIGIWNATAPRCQLSASSIQCQDLRIPNGYKISGQGPPYFYNDSVVFHCNLGFTLKGSHQIRCSASGTWDPEAPICETETNCSIPEFIIGAQNVSTKKMYNFGAIFTLKCDEGYMLEGSPQSQCQEDHRWDPPLAVCKSLNFSYLQSSHGPTVLSGIVFGTILLILFVGVTLAIISKHREGNYNTNTNDNCKEVAIQLQTQEAYDSDPYSLAN